MLKKTTQWLPFLICVGWLLDNGSWAQVSTSQIWIDATMYGEFAVVIPENASPTLREAGEVFKRYWEACTRRTIPILHNNEKPINVWLGAELCTQEWIDPEELEDLDEEGFIIRTYTPVKKYAERGASKQLLICGKTDLGTLRGVYTFFERFVGVMWLASNFTYTPNLKFTFQEIDYRFVPHFEFRYVLSNQREFTYSGDRKDGLFLSRSPAETDFMQISFKEFLPNHATDSVCLTDETVQQHILMRLRDKINENPTRQIWAIELSPNITLCHCDRCKQAILDSGAESGLLINVWNDVLAQLFKELPGCEYSLCLTFTGRFVQAPSKVNIPEKMLIGLSSEMCDWAHRLDDPKSIVNQTFYEQVKRWRTLTPNLIVRYITGVNYHNGLFISPDLIQFQRNLHLLDQVGIRGVIVHVNAIHRWLFTEWDVIKSYLIPQLLWDPDVVMTDAITKAFEAYYRQASKPLVEYWAVQEAYLREKDVFCGYYQKQAWWEKPFIERALSLVNHAIDLSRASQDVYQRVVRCALPVYYSAYLTPPEIEVDNNVLRENYVELPRKEDVISMLAWLESQWNEPDTLSYKEMVENTLSNIRNPQSTKAEFSIATIQEDTQLLWLLPDADGAILRMRDSYTDVDLLKGNQKGLGVFHTMNIYKSLPAYPYWRLPVQHCSVTETTPVSITLQRPLSNEITMTQSVKLEYGSFVVNISCTNHTDQPQKLLLYVMPNFAMIPTFAKPLQIPLSELSTLICSIPGEKEEITFPLRFEPCSKEPIPLGKPKVSINIDWDLVINMSLQNFPPNTVETFFEYSLYDGYISPTCKVQKLLDPRETLSGEIRIDSTQEYGTE